MQCFFMARELGILGDISIDASDAGPRVHDAIYAAGDFVVNKLNLFDFQSIEARKFELMDQEGLDSTEAAARALTERVLKEGSSFVIGGLRSQGPTHLSTTKDSTTTAAGSGPKALPPPRARGNPGPVGGQGTFYVDRKGNVIPTPPGGGIQGSPDGRFIQAKDASGNSTGVRIDGPHHPAKHSDPRALAPHGHVPGVTNPDGTPWLPIK
jgi:hypothetical protein